MKTKEERKDGGGCYSNFDHTFYDGLEKASKKIIENPDKYFGHSAWNFYGHVWFEDGIFYEKIFRYGTLFDTVESESLEDVIKEAILIGGGE